VRVKAKRLAGQFEPRPVLDVIAPLDDMLVRSQTAEPVVPILVRQHDRDSASGRASSARRTDAIMSCVALERTTEA